MDGKLWDNPAKFFTFDIVFLIIDSSNFCFSRAIGGIFFPHIKDTKFPTIYQSICYKFSKNFFFFAIVPSLTPQVTDAPAARRIANMSNHLFISLYFRPTQRDSGFQLILSMTFDTRTGTYNPTNRQIKYAPTYDIETCLYIIFTNICASIPIKNI